MRNSKCVGAKIIPLFPTKEEPMTKRRFSFFQSPAARWWANRLSPVFTVAAATGLAAVGLVWAVNQLDVTGRVGVVGNLATNALVLDCGGTYDAAEPGIFLSGAPCGAKVRVTNPANQKSVIVPVIHRHVVDGRETGRVADMTPATAKALGFKPAPSFGDNVNQRKAWEYSDAFTLPMPHRLTLRVVSGGWGSLKDLIPQVAAFQPEDLPVNLRQYSQRDIADLTLNAVKEGDECGVLCGLAPTLSVIRRTEQRYLGKATFSGTIYAPSQYSWTFQNPGKVSAKRPEWKAMQRMVYATLTGQLSGDYLAVRYMADTCFSYASLKYVPEPRWLRTGEFDLVVMPNSVERLIGARCGALPAFRAKAPQPVVSVPDTATAKPLPLPPLPLPKPPVVLASR
jgi:hypothetical protein